MKRYSSLKKLFLLTLTVVICIILASCKDDDQPSIVQPFSESSLLPYAWRSNIIRNLSLWDNENNASISSQYIVLFFLGGNNGIGRQCDKEYDTYFGSSSGSTPFSFTYEIQGNSIVINGKSYRYNNETLSSTDGRETFTRVSRTSDDEKWLESAKYYVMPDNERFNFQYGHVCDLFMGKVFETGSKKECAVAFYLSIESSEHVFSRGITSITATYRISGGTFSKTPETVLIISSDEDCQANSDYVVVTTTSKATVTTTISIYDSKTKRNIKLGSTTFEIPQDNWLH